MWNNKILLFTLVVLAAISFSMISACAPYGGGGYDSSPSISTCGDARAELAYCQSQLQYAQKNSNDIQGYKAKNKNDANIQAAGAFAGGFSVGLWQQRVSNAQGLVARLCN